jgi:hypothetical protein
MAPGKSVLIIGFEPTLLDYSTIPDLDAATVMALLKADEAHLRGLGYEVELCLTILAKLRRHSFEIDSGRNNSIVFLLARACERFRNISSCLKS